MKASSLSRFVIMTGLAACIGCEWSEPAPVSRPEPLAAPANEVPRPRIVVLGDSLTAGLGVQKEEAYPALLQQRLLDEGHRFEVVNAGVSGDTSAGGVRRLDWALQGDVRILVLALGANDGLRGLPVDGMKRNLETIINRAQGRGVAVLLTGMEAPPNYGEDYSRSFRNVFRELAREYDLEFVPFLLQDVAGIPELNQGDGIHPSSAGARKIADGLWPTIEKMIAAAEQAR